MSKVSEDLGKNFFLGSRTLYQRRDEIFKILQESVKLCKINYAGKKELATEKDETIFELCEALQNAFFYGLRYQGNGTITAASLFQNMQEIVTGSISSGSGGNEDDFWDFCQIHLTPHEKSRYDELKQVWNKCGRGRAFIRATLNENSLKRYVLTWLNDKSNLDKYYTHWSLLLNIEMGEEIAKLIGGLDQVLFALTIDTVELNTRKRLSKFNAIKSLAREEPLIYAPTPAPATSNNGTKCKVKERPIASTTSTEDLMAALNVSSPKQELSLNVTAKAEQPTLSTCMNVLSIAAIEPKLEFPQTSSINYTELNFNGTMNNNRNVEDNISDDNSSQYSKSSAANYCTISTSASLFASAQQLVETEERLQKMTEHCLTLETRVNQLSLENHQLILRLKQIVEATRLDPTATVVGCNFLITIPQVKLLKTLRHTSSYYAYEILITTRLNSEQWSVLRRYGDFYKLHQSLLRSHPFILSTITLPPKKHFGNMNSVFVEERRAQLQNYLLHVVESLPQVEACKSKAELQKTFPFFRQK